jgi:hypothetical protein
MTSTAGTPASCSRRWLGVITGLVLACAGSVAVAAAKPITEADVTAAVTAVIAERSRDGAFALRDPKTDAELALVLEDVRVVRGLEGYGWFPDVIFHDKAEPKKKYAVDFWLKPEDDKLKLMDVRVHKEPRPDGSSWMMITRAPLLWWWLPTIKRQSAVAGMQAWQVLGAVHEHVVRAQKDGGFPLSDEAGKSFPAELVEFHQPVGRSKDDGRYFACAEFRKLGSATAFYSVDFEFDPKARSVVTGSTRVRDPPRVENGTTPAQQRCRFEGLAYDAVE